MEFSCGWTKLHKWPDINIFGFAFKMGAMEKIKLPMHRSIDKCLRQYPRDTNFVVPDWNEVTDIDENLRLSFCGPPRRGMPKTSRRSIHMGGAQKCKHCSGDHASRNCLNYKLCMDTKGRGTNCKQIRVK